VADEHVKVWSDRLPHALTDVFGLTYNQFSRPDDVGSSCATISPRPVTSRATS
jgi:hypothetical protein